MRRAGSSFLKAAVFLAGVGLISPQAAWAKLKVVTSLPDLAWAAARIGGEHVSVDSMLKGHEDPHHVDAVPEFILKASNAQVVCFVGLELEVGWLPKVLARSGNADVQPGGKGFCDTGTGISVRQKPSGLVDRSMGDLHPNGNPHYWLSPKALAEGAAVIAKSLSNVDPENAEGYFKRLSVFQARMDSLVAKNRKKFEAWKEKNGDPKVMEYHQEFAYFFDLYGLTSRGAVEEKPGVLPSAGRIAQVAIEAKKAGLDAVLSTTVSPKSVLERFSELSGVPFITLRASMKPGADYEDHHTAMVDEVLRVLKSRASEAPEKK